MIIMITGAMGAGKTTFCKQYAESEGFTYIKCRANSEAMINALDPNENFIIDGALFKKPFYGATAANITVPHEIWGLFAPPRIILKRFFQREHIPDPEYSEEKVGIVQSNIINLVDKAIWNWDGEE